ncbi:MAG TPA: hypothetical protein VI698_01025 [Nitrososphaerales archaeon]|nr:hypothetical protein [Nitrososphaerales archaeon]
MGTVGIPFTEEMHDMILKEARKRNMQPETLLKIWILERAKSEFEINKVEQSNDTIDIFSLPLKVGYILTASATATINALVNEIGK